MSNKLLLDEHPLVIIPGLAVAIGLNEAVILQQVHYWVELNAKAKRNFHDDYYWTYNTLEEWQAQFPFWSLMTVRRTLTILLNAGFLISGSFNTLKQDRTKWYRVDHERLDETIALSLLNRASVQNEQMQVSNLNRPLPETTIRDNQESNSIMSSSPSSRKTAASPKTALPKHEKRTVRIVKKVLQPV